jgi:SAM-dependent methyltransferase
MAAVTCHMALQLMNDAAQVVAEIARILRPAGRLVALVPRGADAHAAPDPVRAAFKDAQRGEPRMARWETVRFGDPAMRDIEATRDLLSRHFGAVTTTALQATQHLTPAGLWLWFSGMYDRELLPEAAWPRVKHRFEAAIAPHLAADGTAALHHRYLLVDASLAR